MSSWLNYFGLSSVSDSTDDAEAKDIASEKAFLEESIKMTDQAEAAKITENAPAAKTGAKATVTTNTSKAPATKTANTRRVAKTTENAPAAKTGAEATVTSPATKTDTNNRRVAKTTEKAPAAKTTENPPAAKTGANATTEKREAVNEVTDLTGNAEAAIDPGAIDSEQEDVFNDIFDDDDVVSTVPLIDVDVTGVPAVTKPQDLGANYLLPDSQDQDEPYWEGVTLAGAYYYHVLAMYMTTRMTTRMTTHTHRPDQVSE